MERNGSDELGASGRVILKWIL